jgi:type IV pilus assembly protein PilO
MTAGDFIPAGNGDFDEPAYPTAFGIELTPKVLGILAAIAGVGLSFFLFNKFVQPVRVTNQALQADIDTKEAQLANQQQELEAIAKIEAELAQAMQQRKNVYSLFADQGSMDTLLLDLNQRIKNSNASLNALRQQVQARGIPPILVEAKLRQFNPAGETVVTDGSLGEAVNSKLKKQTYNVQFSGDFAQTQAILRNIERLEPLLLISGFQMAAGEAVTETVIGANGQVVGQPKQSLNTTFQIDALIPTGDPNQPPAVAPATPAPAEGAPAEEPPAQ